MKLSLPVFGEDMSMIAMFAAGFFFFNDYKMLLPIFF